MQTQKVYVVVGSFDDDEVIEDVNLAFTLDSDRANVLRHRAEEILTSLKDWEVRHSAFARRDPTKAFRLRRIPLSEADVAEIERERKIGNQWRDELSLFVKENKPKFFGVEEKMADSLGRFVGGMWEGGVDVEEHELS